MPRIQDTVYDNGLSSLSGNLDRMDVCSQEPTTYTEATSTYSLGNAAVVTPSPVDGAVDGRRVIVPAINGASVTASGTATHWAGTDGTSTLYASGDLSASQALVIGNTFNLDATSIGIRDVA